MQTRRFRQWWLLVVAVAFGMVLSVTPAAAFTDVPAGHFAYHDVNLLVDLGLVSGFGDGLYHPEFNVDRGQMAAYIGRTLRSRYVSPKIGWTQHLSVTDDYVIAPAELQADHQDATGYRLYYSTDGGLTWTLDTAYTGFGFYFGDQFVFWRTPAATSAWFTYFRPVAIVKGAEVPLCGNLGHWGTGNDAAVMNLSAVAWPVPLLCWEPYLWSGQTEVCASFYVLYLNQGGIARYYAVVEPWQNRLAYGHEVGWPGVKAAYTALPQLPSGACELTIIAVDMVGNEIGRQVYDFTIY